MGWTEGAGDIEIVSPIVVVIADGDTHRVHLDVQPGAGSHVGVMPFAMVMIERKPGRFAPGPDFGPVRAVEQQNVRISIAVIVEESAARGLALRHILAPTGSAIVLPMDSCLLGDLHKAHA